MNPKVGAILTTDYDNLLEGSFATKYGKSKMLKPVARATSDEYRTDGAIIPVYHMHGYVSYVPDGDTPDGIKASADLVLAEEDYFEALGVQCIWVDTPTGITEVLKEVYCSGKDVSTQGWQNVFVTDR